MTILKSPLEIIDNVLNELKPKKHPLLMPGVLFLVLLTSTLIFSIYINSVEPTKNVVKYIVIFGAILSLLCAVIFYLMEKLKSDSFENLLIRKTLESEINNQHTSEKELKKLHHIFNLATEAGNIGVWNWDIKNDMLFWNHAMFKIYDVSEDIKPVYNTWRDTVVKEDITETEKLLHQALKGEKEFNTTFRIKYSNGQIRYIYAKGTVDRDSNGEAIRFVGINTDITEVTKTEEILSNANIGTWEWDLGTNQFFISSNFIARLGYELHKFSNFTIEDWKKLIYPDDLPIYELMIQKHISRELPFYENEYRIRDGSGRWLWVYDRGRILLKSSTKETLILSGIYFDITERKKMEEGMRYIAEHDELTNLSTRRIALKKLKEIIIKAAENKELVAVLYIDDFKQINDIYGHGVGDAVIKECSARLALSVRSTDIVSRLGGDEFIAILKNVQSKQVALGIAEKILELMSRPYYFNMQPIKSSASIGIAIFPNDSEKATVLISQADKAMYDIKKKNKNGIRCFSDIKIK